MSGFFGSLPILRTATVFAVIALAGCSGGGRSAGTTGPDASTVAISAVDLTNLPGTTSQVTFNDHTVVVDPATIKNSIAGVSDDGMVFAFDDAATSVKTLEPGKVVLFSGVALRKVVAVHDVDGIVFVETEQAALTDAVKEGAIKWSYPLDFGKVAGYWTYPDGSRRVAHGTDPIGSWLEAHSAMARAENDTGKWHGWDLENKVSRSSDRLDLDMKLSKEFEGMKLELQGVGFIQNFNMDADMQIHDSAMNYFSYANRNMNGAVTFSWTASKKSSGAQGLDAVDKLVKLPISYKVPFLVEGIPFVFEVSEALYIEPAFSGKNEISSGKFKFTYSGGQGFSVKGDQIEQNGETSVEPTIQDADAPVPMAPLGFVAAIAMPKLELKMTTDPEELLLPKIPSGLAERAAAALAKSTLGYAFTKAVSTFKSKYLENEAGAYVEFIISGSDLQSGGLNIVPCRKHIMIVSTKVGAGAKLLGRTLADPNKNFPIKTITKTIPDNVKCGE